MNIITPEQWQETRNFLSGKPIFIYRPSLVEQVAYEWGYNVNTKEHYYKIRPEFEGTRVWEVARMIYNQLKEDKKKLEE